MHHPLLRSLFGCVLIISILTGASGCDKRDQAQGTPQANALAGKPRILFFVFGDKADARVLPVARLADGQVAPIALDTTAWRAFDKLYFSAGSPLSIYQNGQPIGTASIRRGMWDDPTPLYKLPRCRVLRPLGAVSLAAIPAKGVALELLAMSDPLPAAPARPSATPADHDSAKALAHRVSQREGITNKAREELDEVLNVITTGATQHPTLVGSYIEQGSGVNGKPRQVFLVGDYDDSAKAYAQTFVHTPGDTLREFRRYIDHLDLTADGIDEIVLEGWRSKSESFLVVMHYTGGHWRELVRGPTSWCADNP